MRENYKLQHEDKLRGLGLAPATCDQVIDLMADQYMTTLDYEQLLGQEAFRGSAYAVQKGDKDKIDREIRALMTQEQYRRFVDTQDFSNSDETRSCFTRLGTRLSYTSAPLDSRAIDQLASLLAEKSGPRNPAYRAIRSDDFIESARALLKPEQHTALRDLRSEEDAKTKRAKLPKSSEIPRL
jgi:hypothetical protein